MRSFSKHVSNNKPTCITNIPPLDIAFVMLQKWWIMFITHSFETGLNKSVYFCIIIHVCCMHGAHAKWSFAVFFSALLIRCSVVIVKVHINGIKVHFYYVKYRKNRKQSGNNAFNEKFNQASLITSKTSQTNVP